MPFFRKCPNCGEVYDTMQMISPKQGRAGHHCVLCKADFDKPQWEYEEDPMGDDDDEIDDHPASRPDPYDDPDYPEADPGDGYGLPGHWA